MPDATAPKPNIAYVRLTNAQLDGLTILTRTRPGNKSDHIRQALDEYLQRELTAIVNPPTNQKGDPHAPS